MKEIIERIERAENPEQVGEIYKGAIELKNKGELNKSEFVHIGRVKDNKMKKIAERGETGEIIE